MAPRLTCMILAAASLGALRDVLDAARDFLRGRALLLDRARDRRGDVRDLADGAADLLDRGNQLLRRALHAGDVMRDISSVAFAVWLASDLTSEATTAKPRPASPARAASMVALSASRLVCSAIAVISLTTSPISCAARDNLPMRAVGLLAPAARRLPRSGWIRAPACRSRRPRPTSSSVADATDCMLLEASSEAPATWLDRLWVVSAVRVSVPAAGFELHGGGRNVGDDGADRGLEFVGEANEFGAARRAAAPCSALPAPRHRARPWRPPAA